MTRRESLIHWCLDDGPPVVKWFLTSIPVVLLLLIYTVRTLESAIPA